MGVGVEDALSQPLGVLTLLGLPGVGSQSFAKLAERFKRLEEVLAKPRLDGAGRQGVQAHDGGLRIGADRRRGRADEELDSSLGDPLYWSGERR